MDFVDRQSTPVYEEKSCDETTVFFTENGSVSKRRRRKSLGRRVSFAEAPSLHIFPRDDEYETPTRAPNASGGSPHKEGQRRSPRLAAKVHDDDKENRVLISNSGSRRRRGASKPLSAREVGSPALKPHNWLDARDSQSQAGDDEENTGPVDLRHLSFEQKEGEEDDENMTLDSTTFALKFSRPRNKNDEPVVVQVDTKSSALSTFEVSSDEDVLEKDMSFTMNRPVIRRKTVKDSLTGSGELYSDMSLTMQVQEKRRKPYIPTGEDDSVDEDSMVLSNEKIHVSRKSSLPVSRDENSALVVYSGDVQNSPVPAPKFLDVRAQIEERWGKDIGDDEINVTTQSEQILEATESVDMSVSPASVCSTKEHEDHTITVGIPSFRDIMREEEEEDEEMRHKDRRMSMDIPSLSHLIRQQEDDEMRQDDRSITKSVPSLKHLLREERDEEMEMEDVDFNATHRAKETLNPTEDREVMVTEAEFTGSDSPPPKDVDVKSTNVSSMELQRARETLDPSVEAKTILAEEEFTLNGVDERSTDFHKPELREQEDDEIRQDDQSITKSVPSLQHLLEEEEDEEMEMDVDFNATPRAKETLNPTQDREVMLTKAQFTKSDSPLPKDVDVRSTSVSSMELQRAREIREQEYDEMRQDDQSISKSVPSFKHLLRGEGDEEMKMMDVAFNATPRAKGTLNPTQDREVMLTKAQFTKSDSPPPKDVDVRSTSVSSMELQRVMEIREQENDEMRQDDQSISKSVPSLKHLLRGEGDEEMETMDVSFNATHRAKETLNPTEDTEVMSTEAGSDSPPPKDVDVRSTNMSSKELQRVRETLNPSEESKMMLAEEEFTLKDVDERSTDFHELELREEEDEEMEMVDAAFNATHRAKETLNPTDDTEETFTEADFTGSDSPPPKDVNVRSTIVSPMELQRAMETFHPSVEAKMMLAEEEFTLKDVDERLTDFHELEVGSKLRDDQPARLQNRIQEGEGESINVTNISVEEFLRHTEVQFSIGLQSPSELINCPSLAETHHVRSLSECFMFMCLKPKLGVMRAACEELAEEIEIKAIAVAELEKRLTASNPAIFSFFQSARECEKQEIKEQLRRVLGNYRLLAEKNRLQYQQIVETAYSSLGMKNTIMYYERYFQDKISLFDEMCRRPLIRLQANLSSRAANWECTSPFPAKVSNAGADLRKKVVLERIEDLKERLNNLGSSKELKLSKLRSRQEAATDAFGGLKQRLELAKNKLSVLRNQVGDIVCWGKNRLPTEEVAKSPYLHVHKMRSEVYLLDILQDGFQVKSAGRENQDLVVELGYRSIMKRRYVVRKVGTAVKVLASSWALDTAKIEKMFPEVSAILAFSLALITKSHGVRSEKTASYSNGWTQAFGQLPPLEAFRFALPSIKTGVIPEPTNLKASMQVTRMLVGNLMELMDEVGKCQRVVNASSGGGVLGEPRFRNATDGQLQLELKFTDIVSSIKFFVILDMSCLPLTGYPFGDLTAKVEVDYCAPPRRHLFKTETLEDSLSLLKPGYQRLVRTCAAVGTFLASLRRGV